MESVYLEEARDSLAAAWPAGWRGRWTEALRVQDAPGGASARQRSCLGIQLGIKPG